MQALSLKDSDEAEDELDDAADEAAEAQSKRENAASKLQANSKPLDQGGGMWVSISFYVLHLPFKVPAIHLCVVSHF